MTTRIPGRSGARRSPRWEPLKRPIQERARATVEAVITAAAQVFEEHGFAAGTTNRIAERAGVSIGTLYQYFPGKEALAVVLVERHVAGMAAALNGWVARTVSAPPALREALRSFVELALAEHEDQSRLHHMLLAETPLPPRVHEVVAKAEQDAAEVLAGVLRLFPRARRPDLRRASILVVQTTLSLAHRYVAPGHPLKRAAFVEESLDMLQAYLEAGRLTPPPPRRAARRATAGPRPR